MSGIQMALLGSAGDVVRITDQFISDSDIVGTAVEVRYRLNSNGKAQFYTSSGGVYTDIEDWVLPNANASSYEVRATLVSGGNTTGTLNVWEALSTSREWTCFKGGGFAGVVDAVLTIEIRYAGGSVIDSATITLSAEVTT